ncbi:hypothetical protein PPYR_07794 [Photinus pyralis]|uniref:Uncharacterized protein n=1 Tax=Photinus pyralis TaxID=7054 RepID=A0A5N4ARG1_PHOPY|nr:uncharacterized protein LOC116168961 [Photinus pyralis]KAB0799914.1 hypothetical protein PPYR_07794 [Photinus pyralis]
MSTILSYTCLFAAIFQLSSAAVPFQVCKRTDPKLAECLKPAIENALILLENGLPEYGIPSIQPISVESWMVPARPPLVYDQKFRNSKFYNYPLTKIEDLSINIDDPNIFIGFTAHNHNVSYETEFEFDGAIIDGEDLSCSGDLTYIYNEMEFQLNFTGTEVTIGGDKKINITNVDMNVISMERFFTEFRGKDTERVAKLSKFYHNNAQYLVAKEKDVYEKAYANIFKDVANDVLSKFSFDSLFPK